MTTFQKAMLAVMVLLTLLNMILIPYLVVYGQYITATFGAITLVVAWYIFYKSIQQHNRKYDN